VLKAGSTLSESGDARFTLGRSKLSEDSSAEVRQNRRYVYEGVAWSLNLNRGPRPIPDW